MNLLGKIQIRNETRPIRSTKEDVGMLRRKLEIVEFTQIQQTDEYIGKPTLNNCMHMSSPKRKTQKVRKKKREPMYCPEYLRKQQCAIGKKTEKHPG